MVKPMERRVRVEAAGECAEEIRLDDWRNARRESAIFERNCESNSTENATSICNLILPKQLEKSGFHASASNY
jgi:hypothetical protein